jgi:hypothetical protein
MRANAWLLCLPLGRLTAAIVKAVRTPPRSVPDTRSRLRVLARENHSVQFLLKTRGMLAKPALDIDLIYDHERSDLFVHARSLHKWVLSLESEELPATALREARAAAWRIFSDISMTGVAKARRRAVLTQRATDQLAKCATAIMALYDRALITAEVAEAGRRNVVAVRNNLGSLPLALLEVPAPGPTPPRRPGPTPPENTNAAKEQGASETVTSQVVDECAIDGRGSTASSCEEGTARKLDASHRGFDEPHGVPPPVSGNIDALDLGRGVQDGPREAGP